MSKATDDHYLNGESSILDKFHAAGHAPNVVLRAADADLMKTYARAGVGIAVAVTAIFDPVTDRGLNARDVSHLFAPVQIYVGINRNTYMRHYALRFLQIYSPKLTRRLVLDELELARGR